MLSKLATFLESAMHTLKPVLANLSLENERHGQDILAHGELNHMPEDITVLRSDIKRTDGTLMPAEWFHPGDSLLDRVLIYFHGGAYMAGTLVSNRPLGVHFAMATKLDTFSFEYRLAPENPFPAGLEDAKAAYLHVLSLGILPENIAFIGDSAGGGMECALMLTLLKEKLPIPSCMVALSPWTDLTLSGESCCTNMESIDPLLTLDKLERARSYYAKPDEYSHPYVSPAFGDFTGCPETLIHVGSNELLLSDSRMLRDAMENSGVNVTLEEWDGLWHVWHVFEMKESREAMEHIADYILKRIG